MQQTAWFLIVFGVLLALIGLVWLLAPSTPWLGRLPGDFVIQRENFRFYFPLTTCILFSLLLSAVVWLVHYFLR